MSALLVTLNVNNYVEALDFVNRMNVENKFNDTNVGILVDMFPIEANALYAQGIFKIENN